MKLKEFRKIINMIPTEFDNVEISIITNHSEYLIKNADDIEWYNDDMNDNKPMIDITVNK